MGISVSKVWMQAEIIQVSQTPQNWPSLVWALFIHTCLCNLCTSWEKEVKPSQADDALDPKQPVYIRCPD